MKIIKLIFTGLIIFAMTTNVIAQDLSKGQISEKDLMQIKKAYSNKAEYKALTNAVTNNDIQKLALNRENLYEADFYFSNKVKTSGITNQKSSGRCWLFTGLNVIKPFAIKNLNVSNFEFSQNYCFFWDQLEKANLFLEGIITTIDKPIDDRKVEWFFKHPLSDGGQWTGVVDIIEKYGVVPKDVMPESYNSDNTRMMSRLVKRKLREDGMILRDIYKKDNKTNKLNDKKIEMLGEVYRILAITLGEPPVEFSWRYKNKDGNISELKNYTPKSFYKEAVGINLNDYVMFMNDPSRELNKLFEIEYDRHIYEGNNWKFINLPIEQIKEFAKASIIDNEAMYFSCDVGKQLNKNKGTLDVNNYNYGELFGVNFGMNKKQRIQTFESGSTHGMTLIAIDIDESGKTVKW